MFVPLRIFYGKGVIAVRGSKFAAFLSGVYVLAALLLLLGVCGHCYPAVEEKLKEVVTGEETSPVRQAFGVLADGLESGDPIRETVADTVQVLFGTED